MRNKYPVFTLLFFCTFLPSCAINKINDEKTIIELTTKTSENPISISLQKGPEWSHKITPGPFIIHIYPQIVFWLEDSSGKFLKTLYITGADGDFTKHATKKKMEAEFFRQSFPIWSEQVLQSNNQLPSSATPYPDAITSATPQSSFVLRTELGDMQGSFKIFAEVNKSGDYNDYYTENLTDWIGQPSIIYSVQIDNIIRDQMYPLELQGHSEINSDGNVIIDKKFDNFDTAVDMIKKITIKFKHKDQ